MGWPSWPDEWKSGAPAAPGTANSRGGPSGRTKINQVPFQLLGIGETKMGGGWIIAAILVGLIAAAFWAITKGSAAGRIAGTGLGGSGPHRAALR